MKLEEFHVYQLSMEMGEKVWEIVIKWDYFSKDTIGKQLVRSVDSVAANLSEGYGRFHFNETKHFDIIQGDHYSKQKPGLRKQTIANLFQKMISILL